MALRSGYYGVKKNVLKKLLSLANIGIQSLGSMFRISSDGELTVREATATIPGIIKLNDIPSGGGGLDLSTTAHKVGTYNGEDLYEKTITKTLSGSGTTTCDLNESGVKKIVMVTGMAGYQNNSKRPIPVYDSSTYKIGIFDTSTSAITLWYNSTNDWNVELHVFFTKN